MTDYTFWLTPEPKYIANSLLNQVLSREAICLSSIESLFLSVISYWQNIIRQDFMPFPPALEYRGSKARERHCFIFIGCTYAGTDDADKTLQRKIVWISVYKGLCLQHWTYKLSVLQNITSFTSAVSISYLVVCTPEIFSVSIYVYFLFWNPSSSILGLSICSVFYKPVDILFYI